MQSLGPSVACTITAHHLELVVDDWAGQPHHFCKPVAKYHHDRDALRAVVREGMFLPCWPWPECLPHLHSPLASSNELPPTPPPPPPPAIPLLVGNPKFFLGSDSAPHLKHTKEGARACAGVYTSPYLAAYLAHILDSFGAIDRLHDFACRFGRDFYRIPTPLGADIATKTRQLTLVKEDWVVPMQESVVASSTTAPTTTPNTTPNTNTNDHTLLGEIVPFFAGRTLSWKIKEIR